MKTVIVSGSFDLLRSPQVRLLEEAAGVGRVTVLLWSDELVKRLTGCEAKFPLEERKYCLNAIRYVAQVQVCSALPDADSLPISVSYSDDPIEWVVDEAGHNRQRMMFCASIGIGYRVIPESVLNSIPDTAGIKLPATARKKAIVTGCFDWLHSGHVRFFEEVSNLGSLYVVVGSDANVALLKGRGHPLFSQDERRYLVGAIRYVTQALISTGHGWMDAEPEIAVLKPDLYVVNEDGDQPEKRQFCAAHNLEYIVLKRLPRPGLPRRESSILRGF